MIPIIPPNEKKVPKWTDFNFDEKRQLVLDFKNGPNSTKRGLLKAAQRFESFLDMKKVFYY